MRNTNKRMFNADLVNGSADYYFMLAYESLDAINLLPLYTNVA